MSAVDITVTVALYATFLLAAAYVGWRRGRSAVPAIDVRRLRLLPGDIILISTNETLTKEAIAQIRHQLEALAPGHKAAVLDRGLEMSDVLSAEAVASAVNQHLGPEVARLSRSGCGGGSESDGSARFF